MSGNKLGSLRTPLGHARGLGSAKSGTGHFLAQRWTALALVPLVIWFVIGLIGHLGASYAEAMSWIGNPVNAVLTVLMLAALFHHAQLGLQVVIEDYIHHHAIKIISLVLIKGMALLFGAGAIFAVLRISFGGLA
jgi:succinate dehydrogenase / fumarate reductase membrane anchor subunit